MAIESKVIDAGSITEQAKFSRLAVSQDGLGKYSLGIVYRIDTIANGIVIASRELEPIVLGNDSIVSDPDFATMYPALRDFCRAKQAAATPDLFVTQ